MENIQNVLKKHFKGLGISQQDIANKLGVTQSAVSSLLNGKRNFTRQTSALWERELGISAEWLMTGKGEMLAGNKTGNVTQHDNSQFAQGDIINNADPTPAEYLAIIKKQQEQMSKQQEQMDQLIQLIRDGRQG